MDSFQSIVTYTLFVLINEHYFPVVETDLKSSLDAAIVNLSHPWIVIKTINYQFPVGVGLL